MSEEFEPGSTQRNRHRQKMVANALATVQAKIDNLCQWISLTDNTDCPEVRSLLKEHGYETNYNRRMYEIDLNRDQTLEKSEALPLTDLDTARCQGCCCGCCLPCTVGICFVVAQLLKYSSH